LSGAYNSEVSGSCVFLLYPAIVYSIGLNHGSGKRILKEFYNKGFIHVETAPAKPTDPKNMGMTRYYFSIGDGYKYLKLLEQWLQIQKLYSYWSY
jgi:hypothetical protein